MNNAELIITLTLIKGLGRKTINKIIRQGVLNSLETSETIDYLNNINLKIKGIITKDELKYANEVAKRTIEICDREDIKISTLLDEDFPQKLKNIDDNPVNKTEENKEVDPELKEDDTEIPEGVFQGKDQENKDGEKNATEEQTEEEEIEDITEEESSQVGAFFDAFAESLGWDVSDEERPDSIEGLISYIQ